MSRASQILFQEQFPKLDQGNSAKAKLASLEVLVKALARMEVKRLPQDYQDYLKNRVFGPLGVHDKEVIVKDLKHKINLIKKNPRAYDFGFFVGVGEMKDG